MLTLSIADERTWLRATAPLMGTTAELLVDASAGDLAAAFRRLHELEHVWSRFDATSELNALHDRPGMWVSVSDALMRALIWAQRMHAETDGLFDPTIRRALERSGYDRTFRSVADSEEPAIAVPAPGLAALELDRERRRVRLERGVHIDLGGIGKGLAADMVAAELMAAGARAVCISLGGDIHAQGEPPDERGWPVPLLHPSTGVPLDVHPLVQGGLAMSTVALRRWRRAGQEMHHIIDPRSGAPCSTELVAVAVAASSTARAEALAKATLVAGPDDGAALLRRCGVRAWIVPAEGDVVHVTDAAGEAT